MLAQYNLDAQLLVVVFEVLNVESADALQTVVQQPHEVPFPSPSDIRVSGAGPRVVLRNKVSIVSPVFFELLEKTMRLLLREIQLFQYRVTVEVLFEVYS
jgi:hypothetical protein